MQSQISSSIGSDAPVVRQDACLFMLIITATSKCRVAGCASVSAGFVARLVERLMLYCSHQWFRIPRYP